MIDLNRPLNCVSGQIATVALILIFLQAGNASAGLVLDSWGVGASVEVGGIGGVITADESHSSDPQPRTATTAVQFGGSTASAFQSPGGWDSAGARLGADLALDHSMSAFARFDMTVRNTGPDPIPLDFRFLIFGGRLELAMTDFAATSDIPTSEVNARFAEGGTWFWSYTGTLAGANSSFMPGYTTVLVDPQGIGMPGAVVSQALGAASVDLGTFGGRLDLGSIAAGQVRSFSYHLFASVENGEFFDNTGGSSTAPPPTVAGFAELKDPFSFGQGFFLNDIPLSQLTGDVGALALPEPETYAMLLVALGLMGIVARRRKQLAA